MRDRPAPTTTRRGFIRQMGILLASLTVTHCVPSPGEESTARARLRRCWLGLDRLEKRAQTNYERGQALGEQLQADHRAALDDLVEAGALEPGVAAQVQLIFDEAVYHIWRSLATCYEPVQIDYSPAARGQLIQQTDLLAEMAAEGNLDPQVVAQAQAALERDITFLSLPAGERDALYDRLLAAGSPYPPYDQLDLPIDSETTEAAAFLIELLSGR